MRVSHRWLTELLPGLDASPDGIAARLTHAGLEVESLRTFGRGLEGVVVAEVLGVEPHPNRGQLQLVTVGLGAAGTERVVCGARNVPEPGGRVVLAREGVQLPAAGITLGRREIGGIESAGMLCSEAELGLADLSDGILILDASIAPGTKLTDAQPFVTDTIFEIGVTPNRPDALGHVGVARDLAALLGLEFSLPAAGVPARTSDATLAHRVRIDNEAPDRCPRYLAGLVTGVRIAPSPAWLRYRLFSLGIRPISNVVDITNLLLLEYGQPMHAFDFDLVSGHRIVVRTARPGEPFATLDGVSRTLDADDLVICDGSGPTALAGIMGGQNSEIRDRTQDVLLECAYFTPRGIRRASRRHGLHTESSHRFERGVDWGGGSHVLERAKTLLTELADGTAWPGQVSAAGSNLERNRVTLRSSRLDAILGAPVPLPEARDALARLGFEPGPIEDGPGGPQVEAHCPSWRPDVSREVDLIDEVARVRGLDRIEARLPAIPPQVPRTTGRLARRIAREAAGLGLSEVISYAFVSPRDLEALSAPAPAVFLENPLSEERSVMRTSLLPGLLETVRRARRRGEREARLFAVGSLFLPPSTQPQSPAGRAARPDRDADRAALPEERPAFAAVLAGLRPGYLLRTEEVDVFDAKGLVEELLERLISKTLMLHPAGNTLPHLHPRGAAEVRVDGVSVGRLGPLHPDVVDALDLDGPVMVVELDLAAIETLSVETPRYRPIPKLPGIARDIAVVLPRDVPAADLYTALRAAAGELCESIVLFDVFEGAGIPEGHRSLAYRLVYRDPRAASDPEGARTLTDREVDPCHDRVRAAAARLGELRA
jgi:phenylalanyl-tRNA synthetase beta chain